MSEVTNDTSNLGYGPYTYSHQPAMVEMSALINEKSLGDTRRDILESESEIIQGQHRQSIANANEFRSVDKSIDVVGRDTLISRFQSVIETKEMAYRLDNKMERESDLLKRQVHELKADVLKAIGDIEKRELNREIDSLRRDKADGQQGQIIALLTKLTETA